MTPETKITRKTYSRAIDLRSHINADALLSTLRFDVIHVTEGDKRKSTARFYTDDFDTQRELRRRGFSFVPADYDANAKTEAEMVEQPLSEKAMLADLLIKGWSGRAFDKTATDFTLSQHQAQDGMGRFTKSLVLKDVLKRIRKSENEARETHRTLTLPWAEKGVRILPATAFHDYQSQMSAHKVDWQAAVAEVVSSYEKHIEDARAALGGLFDANDYPDREDFASRFAFETDLEPLDATGDFRMKLSDAEVKKLQDKVAAKTEARLAVAMTDVYGRLHGVVAHMAERLAAYNPDAPKEAPFRDATLSNVQEIVDLLPKLNLTNDPALDALAGDVSAKLLAMDAKTLRSDDAARANVADAAQKIADTMAGFM